MEKKEKLEIKRQIFHFLFGILIVILYQLRILTVDHIFIIFLIGLIISFISLKHKIPLIYWFLKNFEREQDLKKIPGKGTLTYMLGVLIVLFFFKENIALAAIMILAVGDSVSHIIGKYFGKRRYSFNNIKHIEGTVVGIFLASIAASLFVSSTLAFLGSAAAMITEAIDLRIGKTIIDDNLVIPVVAGLTMHLIQFV